MKMIFKLFKSVFLNKYSLTCLTYLTIIIISKINTVGTVIRVLDGDKETIHMFREMFYMYYLKRGIKIWIVFISMIACVNLFYYFKNKRSNDD